MGQNKGQSWAFLGQKCGENVASGPERTGAERKMKKKIG
jgi:hypothetical protein